MVGYQIPVGGICVQPLLFSLQKAIQCPLPCNYAAELCKCVARVKTGRNAEGELCFHQVYKSSAGRRSVLWNVLSLSWSQPSKQQIFKYEGRSKYLCHCHCLIENIEPASSGSNPLWRSFPLVLTELLLCCHYGGTGLGHWAGTLTGPQHVPTSAPPLITITSNQAQIKQHQAPKQISRYYT